MALDLFNRNRQYGRAFTADTAKLSLLSTNQNNQQSVLSGFAVQDVNFQYRQNIQKLFELGGPNFYYVVPPADGAMNINMLVGPNEDLKTFIQRTGNVCLPATLTLEASSGCDPGEENGPAIQAPHLMLQYCVLNNIAIQGNAQNFIITTQVEIQVGWASF